MSELDFPAEHVADKYQGKQGLYKKPFKVDGKA